MMYKGILIFVVLLMLPFSAMAGGDGEIHDLEGKVWINGELAELDTEIHFGDIIITGGLSRVTVDLDGSIYRVASSSKIVLPKGKENISLGLLYGAFLAVFRHDVHKTIHTRTAVLGVRGTGIYLSERGEETYLCACYGDIDFKDKNKDNHQRYVHAAYHKVVTLDHKSHQFKSDLLMLDHTDEDLFELEEIAGRTPPETFNAENRHLNTLEI